MSNKFRGRGKVQPPPPVCHHSPPAMPSSMKTPQWCVSGPVPSSIHVVVLPPHIPEDPPISHDFHGFLPQQAGTTIWQYSDFIDADLLEMGLSFDCSTNTYQINVSWFGGATARAIWTTGSVGIPYTNGGLLTISGLQMVAIAGIYAGTTCIFSTP